MSVKTIVTAAAAILQAVVPEAVVQIGIPRVLHDGTVLYLYHDGSSDVLKATGGYVRRTHQIPVRLLVLVTGDETDAESRFMDLHDRITGAFYANHHLNGIVASAELAQRDATTTQATYQTYVQDQNREYRQRWWSLSATEDLVFTLS